MFDKKWCAGLKPLDFKMLSFFSSLYYYLWLQWHLAILAKLFHTWEKEIKKKKWEGGDKKNPVV